jgi:hypothetical protein
MTILSIHPLTSIAMLARKGRVLGREKRLPLRQIGGELRVGVTETDCKPLLVIHQALEGEWYNPPRGYTGSKAFLYRVKLTRLFCDVASLRPEYGHGICERGDPEKQSSAISPPQETALE